MEVTERRTAVDMAHFLARLSDETYRNATAIVLVMDHLKTEADPKGTPVVLATTRRVDS